MATAVRSAAALGARRQVAQRPRVAPKAAAPRARSLSAVAGSFYDFSAPALGSGTRAEPKDGPMVSFSEYAGKVTLVQNVATL
jgi:hypothetical protein